MDGQFMKILWGAGAIFAAMFLGAIYYMYSGQPTRESQATLQVRSDPLDAGTVIFSWTGSVDPPMAHQIGSEFEKWKNQTSRIIIELDSPGGSEIEGDRVIEQINRMKETHKVWTYVGPGRDCLSMCVPIYLQGRTRVASPSSNWLFHDAKSVDKITGTQVIMYSNERGQANVMFFYKYIDRSDINPKWRDSLKRNMELGDVWKTGQELKDERSNIVTILE
ncbi:hypothetical protein [Hyphococcus sp.]|uniref:hypothetical protein n=1 Tax=Hyphococcus sp. TaxID=2038636 RepID=UPI0020821A1A|nr:MAG: hypothetical protein DHS20C04_28800 [Marinicaulis sp.]